MKKFIVADIERAKSQAIRLMEWEKAKGHLLAMLHGFYGDFNEEAAEDINRYVDEFIELMDKAVE